MRGFQFRCFLVLGAAILLLFPSCTMGFLALDAKTETFNGWTVSRLADSTGTARTTISKPFGTSAYEGVIELSGSDIEVNQVLNGQWEIGFSDDTGETVLIACMDDTGATSEQTRSTGTMSFKVTGIPKAVARTTNFGGTLSAGNTVWISRNNVWFGANALCMPASGNTDLELWWSDWGTWRLMSNSRNTGTATDQVAYNHGPWWGNYRLSIIAMLDSTYTGQVSW